MNSDAIEPIMDDDDVERLLVFIRDMRGFDFTGYKRTTLRRRIAKRMRDVGAVDVDTYRDRLEADPREFSSLFDTALINVTSFFRDPECWEFLRAEIVPSVIAGSEAPDSEIRIWSAGCAGGQEAYSLAMTFADALGPAEFDRRVKIYGTDVDEAALAEARAGNYSAEQLQSVPADLRDRHFTKVSEGRFTVNRALRHRIIFGRHDLTTDAPISRVDLITCRNTLMYFNAETQSLIVDRLHFGLRPQGVLFLGRAEMLLSGRQFTTVSVRARMFRRAAAKARMRGGAEAPGIGGTPDSAMLTQLYTAVIEAAQDATIVVGTDGTIVIGNRSSHTRLGLADHDLGRPFARSQLAYGLPRLRDAVERAALDGAAALTKVSIATGDDRLFNVAVRPLRSDDEYLGAAITFTDITDAERLAQELERHRAELESTQARLRAANEEQAAANEELQSMNEELETTNEELQSTNEELETTNEELQSTNEELETLNEEIRLRGAEADEYSAYLHGVLASMTAAVAVLDSQARVRFWNASAEHMWGLRAEEVRGEPFFGLDFGLPTDGLREMIAAGTRGERAAAPVHVDAINRLGRALRCSVRVTPLLGDGQGVVLVIEQVLPPDSAIVRQPD